MQCLFVKILSYGNHARNGSYFNYVMFSPAPGRLAVCGVCSEVFPEGPDVVYHLKHSHVNITVSADTDLYC